MPVPTISVGLSDEDDEDVCPPKNRPKPLISVPIIMQHSDEDTDEDESSETDVEDMMTAEEEAAARKYLSGGAQTEQRRLSSLDVYLAQPQKAPESMLLGRRLSMREEEIAVAEMNSKDNEAEKEKEIARKREEEREAVKRAREEKSKLKVAQSPTQRKKTYEKHGLGGFSKERRNRLKEIIMRKAKEEMRNERLKEMQKREDHLKAMVPSFNVDDLNESQLKELLMSWHQKAVNSEQQRHEWLEKVRKQDEEINELTMTLLDIKGKYPMPILRKVPKPQTIMARFAKIRSINAMHVVAPESHLKGVRRSLDETAAVDGPINGLDGAGPSDNS